ncbi:hypothetical protein [Mucilaginibacter segetis]|uniref:Uncharacterized protein n=1 Tax=Mucilaginibacter segetis TaxID=2793071 RepID=A0A934UNA1_9SPHI|nr:hypothetical protein [Mucilaginibacter segetis]MBK0380214.1 hypothetical protein [Mucilaginibacter segetis]
MLKSYQSIYIKVYRWSFKNFGQGKLPQFKSLFNVSFLLIILLTNVMLITKLILKEHLVKLNIYSCLAIVAVMVFFLIANHFILLNNRWLKKVNVQLATVSRRNITMYSVVLMTNVIIACGFCLI